MYRRGQLLPRSGGGHSVVLQSQELMASVLYPSQFLPIDSDVSRIFPEQQIACRCKNNPEGDALV